MHNHSVEIGLANDGVPEDLDIFQQDYESGITSIPFWKAGQASDSVVVGDGLEIVVGIAADGLFGDQTTWLVEPSSGGEWTIRRL